MKKSFLNATSPFITQMVQVPTPALAKQKIEFGIKNGATAIGFQMSHLEKQYHTEEIISTIIESALDKPFYFTNYRGKMNEGVSDEELMDGLLMGLKCGATMVDIMGDTFDPSPEELTVNPKAIKRQMELIDKVHNLGGEVLMSSHIYEFRNADRVLEIALAQQSRGVDFVKIVTGASCIEDELKNLEICRLLKQELKVPFLFLSSGEYSYLHRTVGPALGVNMWLCLDKHDEYAYPGPPLLDDVVKIKQGLKL